MSTSTSLNTASMGRRVVGLLAAVTMIMALAPASPASAHTHRPVVAAVVGTANLSGGINACGASGTFSGTAVGFHGAQNPDIHPIAPGVATAAFVYCNTLVTGTASGTLTIAGHACGFSWTRAGASAIILFTGACTGGGAAGFAPDPTNPNGAVVAGLGAAA